MFIQVNENLKINTSSIERAFIVPSEEGYHPYMGEVSLSEEGEFQLSKEYCNTVYYSPGEFVVVIDTDKCRYGLYGEFAKKAWELL